MRTSQTPVSVFQRIKIKSIIAFAILVCPFKFANAQVGPGGLTGIISNMLLVECPVLTEPPLKRCTSPVLQTQADVDAFKDVKIVKGHLQIEAEAGVDLSAFDKLREIHGILYLQNTKLSSLDGFNNLESVGTRTASFGFGRQVYIDNNPNLTSISGFQKLKNSNHPEAATPSIYIRFNPLLREVSGFTALDKARVISIRKNANLSSVTGFNSLSTLDNRMFITDSSGLTTLPSFANLTIIGGPLELYNLPSLSSIPAFQALTYVKRLRLHNLGMSEMGSFKNSSFTATAGVTLTNNRNLTRISGFTHLRSIEGERGDFRIDDNELLEDVTGFNSLITNDPTDYISVAENPKLDCPAELSMLEDVAYSQRNLVNCQTTPYSF